MKGLSLGRQLWGGEAHPYLMNCAMAEHGSFLKWCFLIVLFWFWYSGSGTRAWKKWPSCECNTEFCPQTGKPLIPGESFHSFLGRSALSSSIGGKLSEAAVCFTSPLDSLGTFMNVLHKSSQGGREWWE